MKISYSLNSDLKSHPNKLLKDHLFNVGNYCKETLSLKKLNISVYVDSDILKDVIYLIGIGHDFGKATAYFQKYIRESDEMKKAKLKNKPETHHGLISAIFTYYIVKEYLKTKNLLNEKYYEYLPVISFLVVKRHHGNLQNADDEIIFDDADDEILEKQMNSIDFGKLSEIYNTLFERFKLNWKVIKNKLLDSQPIRIYDEVKYRKEYMIDISKEKRRIRNIEENLFFYFTTLVLYSILLDADKMDAANLKKVKRIDVDENLVDKYKKLKFKKNESKKINKMRNEIYDEVISNVGNVDLDSDKIFSLNVPTGTGKTLTALSFALKLRKRIESEKGYKSRIIYSLPFLSIIDQNFSVFENIFKVVTQESQTSDILLKHHHLSDVLYTRKEDEFENSNDKDRSKDLLLIEGWNSEIVVTTFIQFFYSLISNKNRAIRKVHNMVNAIVILDEIQAIPHKYWLLLKEIMGFFAKHFNTFFIFITATQPLIFDETKGEIISLVRNKEKYFNALNRVELNTNLNAICFDDFRKIIEKDVVENNDKSFLIILNTINTSKNMYNFIKELKIPDRDLYYLSTNIIPKERLKRIKESKKKIRSIIVSTQLVEAGVDIDVDVVYRDFAPLDSINQAAGRCNRNFNNKRGTVKLFILMEKKGEKTYYPYTIYENFLISKTKEVLKAVSEERIEESKFLYLSQDYFERVNVGKSEDKSREILKKVEKLKFDELSAFKLIEKSYPQVDTFIELDENAQSVWEKYQEIVSIKNFEKRRKEFLIIKKKFYDYVISVPARFDLNLPPLVYGFYYVSNDQLDNYYDKDTGFHPGEVDIY